MRHQDREHASCGDARWHGAAELPQRAGQEGHEDPEADAQQDAGELHGAEAAGDRDARKGPGARVSHAEGAADAEPAAAIATATGSTATTTGSTATATATAANGPPTAVALSSSSVAENQPTGTTVGTLSATDPNPGDTLAFSLVAGAGGDDNGTFATAGDQLRTAAVLDFESKPSHSIRVQVSDGNGGTFARQLTITVIDSAAEPPLITTSTGALSYTEGAPAVVIDAGLDIFDGDSPNLVGATAGSPRVSRATC